MPRTFSVITSQLLGKAGFISAPCFLILVIKKKKITVPRFVRVEVPAPPPVPVCTISRLHVLPRNKEVHLKVVPR